MGKLLLIGDNPFQGISHLSQERARSRSETILSPAEKAANVVLTSLKNGADGFSFSVSEHTLSILQILRERRSVDQVSLYPMVPYAFEYVRVATQTGTPGLVKRFAKQVALSGNVGAILDGLWSVIRMNPKGFMRTYLTFELSRIRSSAGRQAKVASVLLNELVVDMGLALDLAWLFKSFISYLSKRGITPGLNTRNFPYLIKKLDEWGIESDKVLIVTPFNKAGFQMNPSKEQCERTLANMTCPTVLAISVLAAGYYKPKMVLDYLASLDNLKGLIVGTSNEQQARETFMLFREAL